MTDREGASMCIYLTVGVYKMYLFEYIRTCMYVCGCVRIGAREREIVCVCVIWIICVL